MTRPFGPIFLATFLATFIVMGTLSAVENTQLRYVEVARPVNGLQLGLASASPRWVVGTAVELEVTLKNVGETPFSVDLFGDINELYEGKRRSEIVPSCWTLTWDVQLSLPGVRKGRAMLDPNQFVRLQPGESTTKHLSVKLPSMPAGRHRIQMAYTPRTVSPSFNFPNGWHAQHFPSDKLWAGGMVFSNALTIEIIATP